MKRIGIAAIFVSALLLSGCGGGFLNSAEQQRIQQQVSEADLVAVQSAVNQFQQDTGGLLPIKTTALDTDIYIKYLIDFQKLVPKYMTKIPDNAYEQGGIYQYVLWDVEQQPTVKLVDLNAAERIREVNLRVMVQNYPAFNDKIDEYMYTLDFEKMGLDELSVRSAYSTNFLPLVVTTNGEVVVDYRIDLQRLIKEEGLTPTQGEDIRSLLVERFDVLPAYSVPYTVNDNNEVIFMYEPAEKSSN